MSKRSLFWGNASGKLGEAVYYRAGGEQRTRTYVQKIKNPRTNAQAVQRCKLNNLTAFYRSAAAFIQQVNQPEKASMSAFNQFVKNNSKINAFVADKAMIDKWLSIPLNFRCSRGDLNVPTTYNNPDGQMTRDLEHEGTAIWYTSADQPYTFIMSNALPEVEFEGTKSADAAAQARGFLYGKEFYQVFAGNGNPYGLPAEFAVFIVVAQYADEGFAVNVMGVKCSQTSDDQLHPVIVSSNNLLPVGNPAAYLMPVDGTLTKGSETANMKLEGTTMYFLGDGSTEYAPQTNDQMYSICVAYRDESGIHASPCILTGANDSVDSYTSQWLPTGEIGSTIVSQYETASNTIV